ncbi:MAG TPA: hypothetical protein VLQ89_04575 [Candidatus Binatia bacterium]|nr:hypothetical protein [Candidatus Binatia bacterium]
MRMGKLARVLFRVVAGLAAVAVFAVFDWYPTVRDLSRLRLERNDLERKTRDDAARASRFAPPDDQEEEAFNRGDAALLHSLPREERVDGWQALVISDLRASASRNGIRSALGVLAFPGTRREDIVERGGASLSDWIRRRPPGAIAEEFSVAADASRFFWRGAFAGLNLSRGQNLARRPLAMVLSAPLPALLNFVNHISWGKTRLEIVRLRLEPGAPDSLAWIVVRGHFLTGAPSAWDLRPDLGQGEALLVDPDSPLLWQKLDPGFIFREEKRELASAAEF